MPLFRFINPTPDTGDAEYDYPVNPDPARFESVDKPRAKAAKAEAPSTTQAAETGATEES